MKIVRPTEVTVTFEDAGEAARWLAGYLAPSGQNTYGFSYPSGSKEECATLDAAEAEAIRVLATQASRPVAGVTRDADKEHAAPTYISGSSDRVYLISEMPTRYIRNVLNMEDERQGVGLRKVLVRELQRRGEPRFV